MMRISIEAAVLSGALALVFATTTPAKSLKSVTIANTESNPVPVVSVEDATTVPVQIQLRGLFEEGSINLIDTILGPRSYTVPEGYSMLIRYATCEAVRGVNEAFQFDVSLDANFDFGSSATLAPVVQMVPTAVWESPGPFGDRAVATVNAHSYLNISSPNGPTIGDTLYLRAQRNGTSGAGGVVCTVSGVLFPK